MPSVFHNTSKMAARKSASPKPEKNKSLEFEGIRNEAGRNSFYLSAKKWMDATITRLSKAPTGRPFDSPGQRPGFTVPIESGALKGRNMGGAA